MRRRAVVVLAWALCAVPVSSPAQSNPGAGSGSTPPSASPGRSPGVVADKADAPAALPGQIPLPTADGASSGAPNDGRPGVTLQNTGAGGGIAGDVSAAGVGLERMRANPAVPIPDSALGSGALPAGAAALPLGPFYVFPAVTIASGYTDNVARASGGSGSAFFGISPSVLMAARFDQLAVSLSYSTMLGRYTNSAPDNFDNHTLNAAAVSQLTARADATIGVFGTRGQDARGLTDYASSASQRWLGAGALSRFGYGAAGATGRIELDAGFTTKRYDDADFAGLNDVDTINATSRFLYRVAPRTQLVLEAAATDFAYRGLGGSVRDSTEYRVRTGANWQFGAVTSGSMRAGWATRQNASGTSDDGLDFGLAVNWAPRTYSVFSVFANVSPTDITASPDDPLSQQSLLKRVSAGGIAWNFRVNERVDTRLFGSYADETFVGNARADTRSTLGAGLSYTARRWLRFNAQIAFEQRDSNIDLYTYRRNQFLISAIATL